MIDGILNVYKEKGYTSHDVVARLRGMLKQKKIGHTGTLDPDATGVLPVCLGKATKAADMLTDSGKEYEAVLLLGIKTDTQDISGNILEEKAVSVREEEVIDIVRSFVGSYEQIPPMYSALKVNGKKLYEYAREGVEIERKSRQVSIYGIHIQNINLPEVSFRVRCSKGTYIRTLCYDIGEKLGCGGCMKSLVRTETSGYVLADAKKLEEIEQYIKTGRLEEILKPVDGVFQNYPRYTVKEEYEHYLYNGNPIDTDWLEEKKPAEEYGQADQVRLYDRQGGFIGIYRQKGDILKPVKIFWRKE
ncbi:MAG: tRNA pseudouridine(55) synthase TruB [Eubacterium sp.]|nr:tRNA pseudouridine(55) synthase TruB [Eubacterium sp.]